MHFPVYIDLSDKEVLIVGAGTIAARRIRTLCGFAGRMTVVAPEILPEITELAERYPIVICRRKFAGGDLRGKFLVLAATNDREQNRSIREQCREQGIMVNVCDDQSLCDFQFPSVVQAGEVVVGLNASGKNHRLVKETRQKLEKLMQIRDVDKKYQD